MHLTVGKLRKTIKDLPDELPVLLPGWDHSYNRAALAEKATVELIEGRYYEYFPNSDTDGTTAFALVVIS